MTKEESGRRLTALAAQRGLSRYAIARALGISHTTAYGWLDGKFKPGRRYLPALASLLEVPMSEINDEEAAALNADVSRQVAAGVLQIAQAVLEGSEMGAATDTWAGEPAPFSRAERERLARLDRTELKEWLDQRAGTDFFALPEDEQLCVLQRLLARPPAEQRVP